MLDRGGEHPSEESSTGGRGRGGAAAGQQRRAGLRGGHPAAGGRNQRPEEPAGRQEASERGGGHQGESELSVCVLPAVNKYSDFKTPHVLCILIYLLYYTILSINILITYQGINILNKVPRVK